MFDEQIKTGFVTIIGRPNAGKSTLLNNILKQKIAIMSDKPQTTRNIINGVYTDSDSQIVFIDTPGIHKPKFRLESRMNKEAADVIQGVDLIYLVVDASVPYAKGDEFVLNMVKNTGLPVFLILNKMDKMQPEKIVKVIQQWQERYDFAEYFPLSAKFGRSFEDLIKTTRKYLPEGGLLYPAEMTSDGAENFRIAELIREKILTQTEDEVPHASAVLIENKEFKKDKVYIQALILVERDSQKGIMIGKQGQMLKKIGSLAREDIEKLLGKKVFLELFVRVENEWRSRDARITEYGYGGASRDE